MTFNYGISDSWLRGARGGSRILVKGGGGSSGVLTPKFAQNRGFALKLPENCMISKKKKIIGGRCTLARHTYFLSSSHVSRKLIHGFFFLFLWGGEKKEIRSL